MLKFDRIDKKNEQVWQILQTNWYAIFVIGDSPPTEHFYIEELMSVCEHDYINSQERPIFISFYYINTIRLFIYTLQVLYKYSLCFKCSVIKQELVAPAIPTFAN